MVLLVLLLVGRVEAVRDDSEGGTPIYLPPKSRSPPSSPHPWVGGARTWPWTEHPVSCKCMEVLH